MIRITLVALLVMGMVMAWRAWESDDRWWLIAPAVVLLALLGRWRGLPLTTIAGRRIAIAVRNRRRPRPAHASMLDSRTTALLRVDGSEEVPAPVVASYLDRYGIRCSAVRVIGRSAGDDRATWIGLTIGAADNLAALQARSPRIPLHETADVVARRLAAHLRERGWSAHVVDADSVPAPVDVVKEGWRAVRDDRGYVAAYRLNSDVAQTLSRVRSHPALEMWTVLEFTGDPTHPAMAAACALRTAERPGRKPPVEGLIPHAGRHRSALARMSPASTTRLENGR